MGQKSNWTNLWRKSPWRFTKGKGRPPCHIAGQCTAKVSLPLSPIFLPKHWLLLEVRGRLQHTFDLTQSGYFYIVRVCFYALYSNSDGLGGAPHKFGISCAVSACLGQAGGGQHWEAQIGTALSPSCWARFHTLAFGKGWRTVSQRGCTPCPV